MKSDAGQHPERDHGTRVRANCHAGGSGGQRRNRRHRPNDGERTGIAATEEPSRVKGCALQSKLLPAQSDGSERTGKDENDGGHRGRELRGDCTRVGPKTRAHAE